MSTDQNNKFEQRQEFLRKIGETINKMQEPLRKSVENAQMMTHAVVSTFQSDAVQNALRVGQEISRIIANCDFTPMLKKFSEALIPIKYIHLLERLKWPLFLINDEELREQILSACAVDENTDTVKEIVFNYCDEDFFAALEADWDACPSIVDRRKPILAEAIQMHKQGSYYASVSMLMCQVYGVASDIVDIAKRNGLFLDQKAKELIAENFEIKLEDIDKEKGRLLQMTAMTESGYLLWEAMANYLKNEILCSSDSKKRWESQPLRNKICHGDQLNFGTQEHSIKAILTIDMLVQLAYEIDRIVQKANAPSIDGENEAEEA